MNRLAVYCGSSMGSDPAFAATAKRSARPWPPEGSASSMAAAGSG